MQDWPSVDVDRDFKELKLASVRDATGDAGQKAPYFWQFIRKFEEILVAVLLYAILLSAIMQPLFRDQFLAWLRDILERTY